MILPLLVGVWLAWPLLVPWVCTFMCIYIYVKSNICVCVVVVSVCVCVCVFFFPIFFLDVIFVFVLVSSFSKPFSTLPCSCLD